MDGENPCCVEWKKKFSKLEERRNALRQAVKLLEQQTDKLQNENVHLKLAIEQERERSQLEKGGKEKEVNARQELEKEVSKLNAELTTLKNDTSVKSHALVDIQNFETWKHEADAEIKRLKQLLESEKKRGDAEGKKADIEKKHTLEARNLVKAERSRAEEERRIAQVEKSKAEECRIQLEKSKNEACELREELNAERVKAEEAHRRADAERKKANKERKNADVQRDKMEELLRFSLKDKKTIEELKLRLDQLDKQLVAENPVEKNNAEELRVSLQKSMNETNELRKELIAERVKAAEASKRVDAEKKKAIKERKHADVQRVRIEELHRLSQEDKKTIEELKFHLNQLQKQSMTGKRMNECLPKEDGTSRDDAHHGDGTCTSNAGADNENVRMLKEKLKLEKKQLKHARRVSKLQELEKSFLKRELNFLKHDIFQLSRRLNMLDSNLCSEEEGIHSCVKCSEAGNLSLKGRSKLAASPGYNFPNESNEGPPKFCGPFNPLGVMRGSLSFASHSGVDCNLPASGIDSESPNGDFLRNTQQNYMTCSTTASFSDKEFVGSQGRGRSPANTAMPTETNLNNNNIEIDDEQIDLVEDTDGHGIKDQRSLCSTVTENHEPRRKKMRIEDQLTSVMWMYSEDKKMQLKIEKELNMIKDLISEKKNNSVSCPAFVEPCTHLESGDPTFTQNFSGFNTDINAKSVEKADLKDKTLDQLAGPVGISASVLADRKVSTGQASANNNTCEDEPRNLLCNGESHVGLVCVDNLNPQDVMTLFPLDNIADEEFFRNAMATPLSPTLPILDPPKLGLCAEDYSFVLAERQHQAETLHSGGSTHSGALDVVSLEIDLIEQKLRVSQQHHVSVLSNGQDRSREMNQCDNVMFHSPANKFHTFDQDISVSEDKVSWSYGVETSSDDGVFPMQGCTSSTLCVHGRDSCSSQKGSISKNCKFSTTKKKKTADTVNGCSVNHPHPQDSLSFGVVFSSTKCENISRIANATFLVSQTSSLFENAGWLLNNLHAVEMNTDLQNEEKVCAFVSMVISQVARQFPEDIRSSSIEHLNSESLKNEIKTLVTDGEQRTLISYGSWAENVIKLIMDFLVHRETLIFKFRQHGSTNHSEPPSDNYLNGEHLLVFRQCATFNQLLAGSMILASICDVLNCASFLWEVSYDILLSHRSGILDTLAIIHVFAKVCGEGFFSIAENDISATTISSLLLHLESALESDKDTHSSLQSSWSVYHNHPCQKCPFTQGCIDIDRIIQILLAKIDDCVVTQGNMHHNKNLVLSTLESTQIFKSKSGSSVANKHLDSRNWFTEETFVCFADTLSLLELLASYMKWRWICDKIFPCLLEIFERCTTVDYSAALLILLGKLSRLGIVDGLEQDGIHEARKAFLSLILEPHALVNQNLQIQLSAVNAIVDLFPVHFEDIIGSSWSDKVGEGLYHCAKGVRDWFSQLPHDQRALALSFFCCADALT